MPLTSAPGAFAPTLASWRTPALTGSISRQVDPTMTLQSVLQDGGSSASGGEPARAASMPMPVRSQARPTLKSTPVQRYSTEYAAASAPPRSRLMACAP